MNRPASFYIAKDLKEMADIYTAMSGLATAQSALATAQNNLIAEQQKVALAKIANATALQNAQFDAQTKELLSNSVSDIQKHINDKINFDEFAKEILKNESIINPIIDMFKLKEELKSRNELKQIKKIKVRSDKYMAPIGEKKYLQKQ